MRNLFLITVFAFCCIAGKVNAQDNEVKKYAVKSGHIEYKLTGNEEGTKSVWFDDYGETYVEEKKTTTTIKMFGMKSVEEAHTILIMKGAESYNINMIEGTGERAINPYYKDGYEFAETMTKEEQEEFADNILSGLGGEVIGEEKILGKTCEIVSVLGSKSWIYKGISLKSETKVLGVKNYVEATSFKEGVNIPADKLMPPKGIEIQDLTQDPRYSEYMNNDYEDEDEDMEEEEGIPLTMPYETFLKLIEDVSVEGFNKANTMNLEGEQYMAVYMKSFTQAFTIIASSGKDMELYASEMEGFETFKKNGKTMHYNKVTEDGATVYMLMIEYPKEDAIISIAATYMSSKDNLLKIASMLNF